jgi:hypothetical protein
MCCVDRLRPPFNCGRSKLELDEARPPLDNPEPPVAPTYANGRYVGRNGQSRFENFTRASVLDVPGDPRIGKISVRSAATLLPVEITRAIRKLSASRSVASVLLFVLSTKYLDISAYCSFPITQVTSAGFHRQWGRNEQH